MDAGNTPPVMTPAADERLGQLGSDLVTLKQEVDGLQIIATNQKKPWYRDVSTIISVLALLFSFGTTAVSLHRTKAQDVQNSRQELRTLLQRLSAIPRENFEAGKRYETDANARAALGTLYAQENALLARQAAEIAGKLPPDVVSATEFYEVAVALQSAYNLSQAKVFVAKARTRATDFNDEVAAIRASAALEYLTGAPESGGKLFREALDIFSKYTGYDQYTKDSTNALTQIQWALSEANQNQIENANEHLIAASRIVDKMQISPGSQGLKMQIAQNRVMIFGPSPQAAVQPAVSGLIPQPPK